MPQVFFLHRSEPGANGCSEIDAVARVEGFKHGRAQSHAYNCSSCGAECVLNSCDMVGSKDLGVCQAFALTTEQSSFLPVSYFHPPGVPCL